MLKIIYTSLQNISHSTPFLESSVNYFENFVICWKYDVESLISPNIKGVNIIYFKK